jgi:hypothetical protein
MNDSKSEKDYFKLLRSGMFWEIYPELTGEWEKDKEEFIKNEQWLNENFRNNMDAPGSKKHKIPAYTMTDFEKKFEPLKEIKIEPKANLLPSFPIERKKEPKPILFIKVPKREHLTFEQLSEGIEKQINEAGWFLLWAYSHKDDYEIESFTLKDLQEVQLQELKEIILKSIKTGE